MKQERFCMLIPNWLKEEIRVISKEKGITMSEYIKDVLKESIRKEKENKKNN